MPAPLLLILLLAIGAMPAAGTAAPSAPAPTAERQVLIGVLSHRGDARSRRAWQPTADYLTAQIPGYHFDIAPLDFAAVEPAVAAGSVDFVLVNPAIYVLLEVEHGVSRIATLRNGSNGHARNVFGGVIFTRAERDDMTRLEDLAGKRFMAVDPTSLGGYEMANAELRKHGVDPAKDLGQLVFGGIHDTVVLAVRDGTVDAGTVRTDVLEHMADAGTIDLADFKILGAREDPDFPPLHSTPLYPEWPFSKLPDTPTDLAQAVAVALLQMPADSAAARAGDYSGWTVALDYQPVHQLLRELQRPPYDGEAPFTLADALAKYWLAVLIGTLALVTMALLTSRVLQLNQRLSRANTRLERRHQLILDSVAEGIYGVDLKGCATFVNKAMERMTGWRAEELIGNETHEIMHHTRGDGEPHPREDCPVYTTFRDEQSRYVEDDVFWRRNGTSFPVEYSATPIRDEQGQTIGTVVVCRDITERREAAERFRRQEAEQTHFTRLSTLGEMASGIAHELNQPLTAITTNARACVRMINAGRADTGTCREVMTKIAEQAERAGEVIRHIRRFVRKEEPEMAPVAVADMFETVLVLMRQDARRAGVALHRQIGFGADYVMAQRTQIEQVLLNLVRNAVEAMLDQPRERRVLLLARRNGDMVEIRVVDTGPGLGKGSPEHLFEPFVTTKPQGLGVGLSISHGIVEAHGGRLRVDSTPGIGATFFFSLPYVDKRHGVNSDAASLQSGGNENDHSGEHA
ncbi:MAG: PhnD/SsuA/transferrin family substrate-binding protein [Thiohalocapsa sp.]|jgi:two-component system sensor histidine kinase TtrS|uniref:PhnD/SsuA/transferrin family substrate-binding protein n=1 Tax=Thiohalocapsa sp. TaxID=2497641 RepID=UPI0025FD51DC|nr:PhnD/SsuA/transferrin family substrate-binding protein [Thiohalocapsa sp.]MCG6940165.1 PhnD/SsuA/transferrin family substrate-binding protein [Thiohalocapsa sp.]